MTLLELCEPLFQAVCRLNRSGRKGLQSDYHQVRSEIEGLLADMRSRAAGTPGLLESYEKIERVLVFFADSMISESNVSFARDWHADRMAFNLSPSEKAGDDRFYDLLDETLQESRQSAIDRLQVFYTCLGLGFTGGYFGQPELLRRKMNEIHARIKSAGEADVGKRICPEAYDNPNTSNLIEPPGAKLVGIVIVMVCLMILGVFANFMLYNNATGELGRALDAIIAAGSADDAATTKEAAGGKSASAAPIGGDR